MQISQRQCTIVTSAVKSKKKYLVALRSMVMVHQHTKSDVKQFSRSENTQWTQGGPELCDLDLEDSIQNVSHQTVT